MNYNQKGKDKRLRIALVFVICALLAGGIIFLKSSTRNAPAPAAGFRSEGTPAQVAVPDTTTDTSVLPPAADTAGVYTLPDSLLGRDKRSPYEAGYEDGYATGCDDGAADAKDAGYDESCSFASAADRATYAKGYQEGYAKGYEDGRQGKQFNISAAQ